MAETRAQRLFRVGLRVYPNPVSADKSEGAPSEAGRLLLLAIAEMLAEATKPTPKRKKAEGGKPTLPFSPQELFEAVKATGTVACEPYNSRWFALLGKKLQGMMPGLEKTDVAALASWLENGGIKWMKEPPSFGTLVKHIEEWIPRARAAAGGQLELDLGACL